MLFLNGDLNEEVFMTPQPGVSHKPGEVCKLRKALYGLKQAPRAWYEKFAAVVTSLGFVSSHHDSALFVKHSGVGRFGLTTQKVEDIPIDVKAKYTLTDVHIVSQFVAAPTTVHWVVVLHILMCLRGTRFQTLLFPSMSSLELCAYCDSDWASDVVSRKSTTGFFIFLGDSLISWKSKKQDVLSKSSTEVEYRVMAVTISEIVWLHWLLADMGVRISHSTPLHCDNRSTIHIARNSVFRERAKHIEIDCHFTCHHLQAGTISLPFVLSALQIVDIFTKPHSGPRFRFLNDKLSMFLAAAL
ncbi:uncharacterized mitochondrial protein-like protein [Tanacetum coccineum]